MIRDYGEDKFARNIAKHIVMAREKKPIETTGELNNIIRAAIPAKIRAKGGHPSKKTYQAIRIELNHELDVLKNTLDQMIDLLNDHGRICVITFHSLEDRLLKTFSILMNGRVHARRLFRMCLREEVKGQSDYQKTDTSQ